MKDTAESSPAVELRGIRKRFGPRTILDGIDLVIRRGEVLVLVGPSGSGKSTLLKMVSGIESPDEGAVWLSGEDATHVPPYRRPVHTVFQNYALFPHLDVAGNVAFPLAVAGVPRAQREPLVQTALGWVQMQSHARRRVDTLSGGERQRVALARALVDQTQCVLLDEPLSALDPHLRASTLELLQEIQSRLQLTYLYITHDRDEALRIGHRIGVLNHGRLEQIGTPEEVYRKPATPFVASFLGRINWLSAATIDALGMAPGARIGIRPEDLHSCENGPLAARVQSRQFSGDSTHVRVMLDDGSTVTIDERPASDVAVGEAVRIDWSPEAVHIFPGEEKPR